MSCSWQRELDETIDRRFDQIVEVRRHLHAHPELSGQEQQSSFYIYQLLGDLKLDVQMGPEGCGVVANLPETPLFSEALRRPRIALRADLDALRIHDEKNVPYRSQTPGVMHACGHDVHAATLVGAILGLMDAAVEKKLPWPVNWRAIFQPAEETCQGAKKMVQAGCLEGVDAILATHVDPTIQVGRIGLRRGVFTAQCDALGFTILGRGGHAARPHETIDPIASAAQLINSVYLFVQRATDSMDAVVVTIGQIIGGDNPNVIPEQVELHGTLRTLDHQVRQRTIEHIRQIARGLAEATGTRIEVTFEASVESIKNDSHLIDLLRQAGSGLLGEDHLEWIPKPSMGGEDFAVYLNHIPGAMFRLGCAGKSVGSALLHTPDFDVDEQALAVGAKVLARTVVLWSAP